jgi:hypothetical protein
MRKLAKKMARGWPSARAFPRRGPGGQAAIEFIMIVVVLFFFLFFLVSIAVVIVVSEYIEYATFMAARTYKAGFSNEARQESNAKLVFDKYFEKVQGIARAPRLEFRRAEEGNEQTAGVLARYDMDLFYMPPLFGPGDMPPSRISLVSESHLGRDPSFDEVCNPQAGSFFINLLNQFGIQNPETYAEQMDDNGC